MSATSVLRENKPVSKNPFVFQMLKEDGQPAHPGPRGSWIQDYLFKHQASLSKLEGVARPRKSLLVQAFGF